MMLFQTIQNKCIKLLLRGRNKKDKNKQPVIRQVISGVRRRTLICWRHSMILTSSPRIGSYSIAHECQWQIGVTDRGEEIHQLTSILYSPLPILKWTRRLVLVQRKVTLLKSQSLWIWTLSCSLTRIVQNRITTLTSVEKMKNRGISTETSLPLLH